MYHRNADTIDGDRLAKAMQALPVSQPLNLTDRLLLSVGMIVVPVAAFFLILGVGRLVFMI